MSRKSWSAFQQDILDRFQQYKSFFDGFYGFQRIKELLPNIRAEAVCIPRDKKEVWIVDAKNKPKDAINKADHVRMGNYVESIRKNPDQVGISKQDLHRYRIFPIFVYNDKGEIEKESGLPNTQKNIDKTLYIPQNCLRAFIEQNVVVKDTDFLVKYLAGQLRAKTLTTGQVDLLKTALEPYVEYPRRIFPTIVRVMKKLHFFEIHISGVLPENVPPIDYLALHEGRKVLFPISVPFKRDDISKSSKRMEIVKRKTTGKKFPLHDEGRIVPEKIIPIVIDCFNDYPTSNGEELSNSAALEYYKENFPPFVIHQDLLEYYLFRKMAVIPLPKLVGYIKPEGVALKENVRRGKYFLEDKQFSDFKIKISTNNDFSFSIVYELPFTISQDREIFEDLFWIKKEGTKTILTQEIQDVYTKEHALFPYNYPYNDIDQMRAMLQPLDEYHKFEFYGNQLMGRPVETIGMKLQKWLKRKVGVST